MVGLLTFLLGRQLNSLPFPRKGSRRLVPTWRQGHPVRVITALGRHGSLLLGSGFCAESPCYYEQKFPSYYLC